MYDSGFDVWSDWHNPNIPSRPLASELIRLCQSDVLIVWPSGLSPEGWLKVGMAHASGIKIIALGSLASLDAGLQKFFMLHLPGGFSELEEHSFMKLGSMYYKKEKI